MNNRIFINSCFVGVLVFSSCLSDAESFQDSQDRTVGASSFAITALRFPKNISSNLSEGKTLTWIADNERTWTFSRERGKYTFSVEDSLNTTSRDREKMVWSFSNRGNKSIFEDDSIDFAKEALDTFTFGRFKDGKQKSGNTVASSKEGSFESMFYNSLSRELQGTDFNLGSWQ